MYCCRREGGTQRDKGGKEESAGFRKRKEERKRLTLSPKRSLPFWRASWPWSWPWPSFSELPGGDSPLFQEKMDFFLLDPKAFAGDAMLLVKALILPSWKPATFLITFLMAFLERERTELVGKRKRQKKSLSIWQFTL